MRKSGVLHAVAVISVLGQRQENPSSSVASQSSKIEDFRFSERSYLKSSRRRQSSLCMCMRGHMRPRAHAPSPTGTQNDMTEALLSGLLSYIQSLSGRQHQTSPTMCRVSFQSAAHATLLPPQPVALQRRCCHSYCELDTLTAPTSLFSLSPKPSPVLIFTDWGNSAWEGNVTSGGSTKSSWGQK